MQQPALRAAVVASRIAWLVTLQFPSSPCLFLETILLSSVEGAYYVCFQVATTCAWIQWIVMKLLGRATLCEVHVHRAQVRCLVVVLVATLPGTRLQPPAALLQRTRGSS